MIISGTDVPPGAICSAAEPAQLGQNTMPSAPFWFNFIPDTDGILNLSTVGLTSEDTRVQVYQNCGGNLIAWGDDENGLQTDIAFLVTAGEELYFRWSNNGTDTTGFDWQMELNPATPSATLDSLVLVQLYQFTGGDSWTNNTNWLSNLSIDQWWGIATDTNGRVTEIDLFDETIRPFTGNNLTGSLPASLKYLSELGSFIINRSQINGELPDLSSLTKLNFLDITLNNFSGAIPKELALLNDLERLWFGGNNFEGDIPEELGQLNKLVDLYIWGNQLDGTVPPALGLLSNLKRLQFSFNSLEGALPPELGDLDSLENLSVWGNAFTGAIPSSYQQLSSLNSFWLSSNYFTDLPNLSGIDTLNSLSMFSNFFTFEDILPNVGITGINYSPQYLFGQPDTFNIESGDTLNIIVDIDEGVEGNSYAWFRNGSLLSVPDTNVLNYPILSRGGAGSYHVQVTNPGAPELTLFSEQIEVIVPAGPGDECDMAIAIDTGIYTTPYAPYWYKYTASSDGFLSISSDGFTAEDTYLLVYDECGGDLLAFNDDVNFASGNYQSAVILPVSSGQTIYINWSDTWSNNSFNWEVSLAVPPDVVNDERSALAAFFFATNGFEWSSNANWLSSAPLGEWYGVTTDSSGHVIEIDLLFNNVGGTLPDIFEFLPKLELFEVGFGNVSGAIPPSLYTLDSLKHAGFTRNNIEDTFSPKWQDLQNLELLALGGNNFYGNIPPELGNLTSLTAMYIWGNQLDGTVPPALGLLSNLKRLQFSFNSLEGALPPELGDLDSLENLSVWGNAFTGAIPSSYQQLSSLNSFRLSYNYFTDLPNLSGIDTLNILDMFSNFFTFEDILPNVGITGIDYSPQYLFGQPDTFNIESGDTVRIVVDIDQGIEGNSYAWFRNGSLLSVPDTNVLNYPILSRDDAGSYYVQVTNPGAPELILESHKIEVALPPEPGDVCDMAIAIDTGIYTTPYAPYWYKYTASSDGFLSISSDGFTAEDTYLLVYDECGGDLLAFNDDVNFASGNYQSAVILPVSSGQTIYINWSDTRSNNSFNWEVSLVVPPDVVDERTALETFYLYTNGVNWFNNTNWLSEAPLGEWYGVSTDTEGHVIELRLFNNGLSGILPDVFEFLPKLQFFSINTGEVTGTVPPSMYTLDSLTYLSFTRNAISDTISPDWQNLSMLEVFALGGNEFTGKIPPELGNLTSLTAMYIWGNNLQGTLPSELGQLTNLEDLFVEMSSLSGNIPTSFENLTNIKRMSLAENNFVGKIPEGFQDFEELDWLWLYENNFDGLPDLSNVMNSSEALLLLDYNLFTFEDILPNVGITGIEYAPQKVVPVLDSLELSSGTDNWLVLDIDTDLTTNSYSWFKDDVLIATTNTDSLFLENVTAEEDQGIYYCVITNPSAPELTLQTSELYLFVSNRTPQSITFNAIPDKVFGDDDFELSAVASSDLPVTFSITEGDGFATINGNTISIDNAGNVTVRAFQAGNDEFRDTEAFQSFVIEKAPASIALSNLVQTYDGVAKAVTISTEPTGLSSDVIYNGNDELPINSGQYVVVAEISDPNYQGVATDTLLIESALATITFGELEQDYDGTAKPVSVSVEPEGLQVDVTYDGETEPPVEVGQYNVEATVIDDNYQGSASTTLAIRGIVASITFDTLTFIYDGSPKTPVVSTEPSGLAYSLTYNGGEDAPIDAGKYGVEAKIIESGYEGSMLDTLIIAKATAEIILSDTSFVTYDGNAKFVTVMTDPEDLQVTITYNGNAEMPINAGYYDVEATIINPNYEGIVNRILVIDKATATIAFSELEVPEDGSPKQPIVMTDPDGLFVELTFNGVKDIPTLEGSYEVVATIVEQNYKGENTTTFVITEPLAISDELTKSLTLYPNPTNSNLLLQDNSGLLGEAQIQVYNSQGKKVLVKQIGKLEKQVMIDVSALPKGQYLLLYHKGNSIGIQQFVKN